LKLQGVTSYFVTRTPTQNELDTCRWIHMTDEYSWDPHSDSFQYQEDAHREIEKADRNNIDRDIYSINSRQANPNMSMIYSELSTAFDNQCIINLSMTKSSIKQGGVNAETLAKIWNIGDDIAKKTIQCTTQKGICSTLHPIERRFRTKQAQLRYNQLAGRHGSFYTDTFFSKAPSLNNAKMAQIYDNDLSFTKIYPMKMKSEAGDTLQKCSYMTSTYLIQLDPMMHPNSCTESLNNCARIMVLTATIQNHIVLGRTGPKVLFGSSSVMCITR
jgi:hypothetical protein